MVIKLRYGNTNTFLVSGERGKILVDTDYAGSLSLFYKELKKHNIKLNDITYVLTTHYHPDHMGLVSELMNQGVKLLLIDTQVEKVHFSDEIFNREQNMVYEPIDEKRATIITCKESRDFLKRLGLSGEIVATPSHSEDSISLVLDNGICFVGDLEPREYLDAYENNVQLAEDWNLVMSYEPKVIYYAHVNEKYL